MNEATEPSIGDRIFAAALSLARFNAALANAPMWMPPADRQRALNTLADMERKAEARKMARRA